MPRGQFAVPVGQFVALGAPASRSFSASMGPRVKAERFEAPGKPFLGGFISNTRRSKVGVKPVAAPEAGARSRARTPVIQPAKQERDVPQGVATTNPHQGAPRAGRAIVDLMASPPARLPWWWRSKTTRVLTSRGWTS